MTVSAEEPTRLPRNRLLASLPAEILNRMLPLLKQVELSNRRVLYEAGSPILAAYFPESGCASMLLYMDDGEAAEVGMIGREGMVGLPLVLGVDRGDTEAMVQCPGTALQIEAAALREEMDNSPALRTLLLRYALVHHGQVVRTAACNGRHQIDQRLARWLLMVHDRADGAAFPLTHEYLSMMLGVRRAGISVAAASFQKAQLIRYERGRIEVTDRNGLENVACECYGIARRASESLLGPERIQES